MDLANQFQFFGCLHLLSNNALGKSKIPFLSPTSVETNKSDSKSSVECFWQYLQHKRHLLEAKRVRLSLQCFTLTISTNASHYDSLLLQTSVESMSSKKRKA